MMKYLMIAVLCVAACSEVKESGEPQKGHEFYSWSWANESQTEVTVECLDAEPCFDTFTLEPEHQYLVVTVSPWILYHYEPADLVETDHYYGVIRFLQAE